MDQMFSHLFFHTDSVATKDHLSARDKGFLLCDLLTFGASSLGIYLAIRRAHTNGLDNITLDKDTSILCSSSASGRTSGGSLSGEDGNDEQDTSVVVCVERGVAAYDP